MQELFASVLSQKDLSKAGDLFSLSDKEIEKDLAEVERNFSCSRLGRGWGGIGGIFYCPPCSIKKYCFNIHDLGKIQ